MNIDYNNISETYDNHRSYGHSEILQLIRFGKIETGMKILDLGCGTGNEKYNKLSTPHENLRVQ